MAVNSGALPLPPANTPYFSAGGQVSEPWRRFYLSQGTTASGTYTPTLTNVTNLDGSTAYVCQYLVVGRSCTVSGKVDVNPTATAATELGISLPFTTDFTTTQDCGGVAFCPSIASEGAAILADVTNNRASMQWVTLSAADHTMAFTLTYQVLQ